VANHSSYLDGVVMKAGLPPRFGFVVKREAAAMPVMGFLLRRIGAEFVDRHSAGGRQRGARRVMQRAEQGHSLVFFPEGTFDSVVGLKRFHIGAFVAAARGGMPLVPTVIHGTRRSMPNGAVVPVPGTIRIEILPSIDSAGRKPDELRDAARAVMLERLGEPDLTELAAAPARAR
jgi:1-acyl-sn-glycerol-3-phosphate acyltransferase